MRMTEEEERWESFNQPYGTEPNRTVTCMVPKAMANDSKKKRLARFHRGWSKDSHLSSSSANLSSDPGLMAQPSASLTTLPDGQLKSDIPDGIHEICTTLNGKMV
ncbi:hypothetical protein TNCV_66471 [Trichonephila clavipes]|nr:hypothetical protein TNCV_66471 [Trichonephila clavipes]